MKKEIKEPKQKKNVSMIMAVTGWAIITLAATFGGGVYIGHGLAQTESQTVQQSK